MELRLAGSFSTSPKSAPASVIMGGRGNSGLSISYVEFIETIACAAEQRAELAQVILGLFRLARVDRGVCEIFQTVDNVFFLLISLASSRPLAVRLHGPLEIAAATIDIAGGGNPSELPIVITSSRRAFCRFNEMFQCALTITEI